MSAASPQPQQRGKSCPLCRRRCSCPTPWGAMRAAPTGLKRLLHSDKPHRLANERRDDRPLGQPRPRSPTLAAFSGTWGASVPESLQDWRGSAIRGLAGNGGSQSAIPAGVQGCGGGRSGEIFRLTGVSYRIRPGSLEVTEVRGERAYGRLIMFSTPVDMADIGKKRIEAVNGG